MKLSTQQTKTFLRIQRKHNVSVSFLLRNMPAIIKFVQYAITPHIVLKRKQIRKRNRVFLLHNYLRKLIFDPSKLKKKQNEKRIHSQWSKRLVMYLRRYKMVEFFEDELATEAKLPEEDVSKQLKQQLELLKTRKRSVTLLEDVNNAERKESVLLSKTVISFDESEHIEGEIPKDETDLKELSNPPQSPVMTVEEDVSKSSPNKSCPKESDNTERLCNVAATAADRSNGNFLDMLISKVKNSTEDASETSVLLEKSMEPPKQSAKRISMEIIENDEHENSNSSSDFFGFDDNERIRGTYPGMLSTPLVENRDFNSAFESETLNAYMRDNSLESSAIVSFPQRRPEDGLVYSNSIPPKLDMPALPEGLQGLRTVAERRAFLQKNRNIKYCIINNVGTIFREMQKRLKGHRINKNAVEAAQSSSTIPLTRQGWKAATWLLTDEGNYYFQTINVDGKNFRLFGCRGNSQTKFKRPHTSRCRKVSSVCTEDCMDRFTFRALRPIRTIERRSKLSDDAMKVVYKACPLSQKILHRPQDDEPVFGSLEMVRMPQVELEVFPQLQKPLNDIAKRYLQLILPYTGITREWAEFSVSTLVERKKMDELAKDHKKSFIFPLPFENDRDHMLIRQVYSRSEAFEGHFDNSSLTFRKEIDQKKADAGKDLDPVEEDCADVLTDMLNSVAISCSENSFLKNDPDNIYHYGSNNDEMVMEKSAKKTVELHQHQAAGHHNKKQSRLLMELKRLNATIIDAAASKSEEEGITCDKETCRLGCVCSSLNEGNTVRQHCGKQRCILECNCKFPSIMRLETDGRTITTEDAFMLRRQATAKLARMEKEFTSTIVLTGSETLLINESQYDKKRRCTKIPKRYGDFVDPNDSDFSETKQSKKVDTPVLQNIPLEPVMVKDSIYQCLRHCQVNVKRLRDIKDLAPWCMTHMVYKCYCKGQVTVGNPIVLEKQDEQSEGITIDEGVKARTLYSFDKEESRTKEDTPSSCESDSDYTGSDNDSAVNKRGLKHDKRGRLPDTELIQVYMNAKANHCRRIIPIPRNLYRRRNRKRVAHVQLYIEENETDQTRLSLNEHVLRSVYYHKNNQNQTKILTKPDLNKRDVPKQYSNEKNESRLNASATNKRTLHEEAVKDTVPIKRRRMTYMDLEEGTSLLRVNRYKDAKPCEVFVRDSSPSTLSNSSNNTPVPHEQITVPKISQIFSLNTQAVEMGTDTAAAVAADIPQQSTEAAASAEGVSSEAFRNVFQVVIKNMNNLVSKKMQDIDMALRRESKAIPAPNDEILCIIRWNNFLEAFMDGFVYLWEVRTVNMTFIAATIRNIMPLVVNALSVVNIRALPRNGLPLMGRMLIDEIRNTITDGLAVVMQGQKMYWFVKGFLRPDKTRVCPKPTPETHPLLTKKINILCRLLINQQLNEHKKRQESVVRMQSPSSSSHSSSVNVEKRRSQQTLPVRVGPNSVPPKLKVLPMQRNISDHATAILEQMVTQAYGVLRSNIGFRKLRQSEINEIYQPASMNSDHHWLVLDLSNDFSHVFVPELKDLLTLDRIQKVMSYAVNKSRIVKMQFSQKSLFNAYVTPMSRRKLYFGPFRNTLNMPKLILLQSVDGQMMLREVYELRHNVTTKVDRTTAFWLIQKRGKLFLDVEEEEVPPTAVPYDDVMEIQDDVQEIIDDDDCVATGSQSGVGNVLAKAKDGPEPVGKEASTVENASDSDDDDDCMIVEDEVPNLIATVSSAPSASSVSVNSNSPERINYTISYAGENSSLVVIQNECERVSGSITKAINNSFTILSAGNESTLVESSEVGGILLNNLQQTCQPTNPQADAEPVNIPANVIMKTVTDSFQPPELPSDIVLSTFSPVPGGSSSTSSEQNANITPSESLAGAELNITPNNTIEKESISEVEKDMNDLDTSLTASALKLNRNITIKKVPVDNETTGNSQQSTIIRKATVTGTGKFLLQNQAPQKGFHLGFPLNSTPQTRNLPIRLVSKPEFQVPHSLRQAIKYPPQKPKTSSPQTPPTQTQQSSTPPSLTPIQRSNISKPSPPAFSQRPAVNVTRIASPAQCGLTVRTPTAINTLIKTQQQQQIMRQSSNSSVTLLRPTSLTARPRLQTYSSVVRMQSGNMQPSLIKSSPTSSSVLTKTPNSAQNIIQQNQYKRVLPITEITMRNKVHKILNGQRISATLATDICPQNDPLSITEESSDTIISNLPQPKLPNDVKTVKIPPNDSQNTKASVAPLSDTSGVGAKRNSSGTIINSQMARLQQAKLQQSSSVAATSKSNNTVTVVTTISNPSSSLNPHVKGIPIELPRLKKFAIIGTANTTVITPPASQSSEVTEDIEEISTPETPIQKRKIIATSLIKPSPTSSTNTLIKASPTNSLVKPAPTSTTNSLVKPAPTSSTNTLLKASTTSSTNTLLKASTTSSTNTTIKPTPTLSTNTSIKPLTTSSTITSNKSLSTSSTNTSSASVLNAKNLIKVQESGTITASAKSNTLSINTDTEYGYFHANIEGLPKFVVKRVNDDFLIKVPNFNGILKLTGLSTVHNYLNQYTTQKCGKTTEEVKNLKWTFRVQDRSKLGNVSKSISSTAKQANTSPTVQKLMPTKRIITTNHSPVKIINNTKPIVASIKKPDPNDPIVLIDDE